MNAPNTDTSRLLGRSALLTTDLDDGELAAVLQLAERFARLDRAGVRTPLLPCELAYAVFFDNSTRTKSAWAGAASRLGMRPVIVDGSSTQVAHGETAAETGAMLGMNAHAMGIRHDLILGEGNPFMRELERGIRQYLEHSGETRKVPVVNLQCDVDHPTQAMADALWLRERYPQGLKGLKVAVSWAYSPSYAKPLSVPQGLAMLLPRLGCDVRLAHPPGYQLMPECLDAARSGAAGAGGSFEVVDDMDAAFDGADVVYPKSWGPWDLMMERVTANKEGDSDAMERIEQACLQRNTDHRGWICDERRMALTAGGDALYMHCLPADIGDEVSPGVMERHRFNVASEANKKVYVIMALLAGAKVPDLDARLDALMNAAKE